MYLIVIVCYMHDVFVELLQREQKVSTIQFHSTSDIFISLTLETLLASSLALVLLSSIVSILQHSKIVTYFYLNSPQISTHIYSIIHTKKYSHNAETKQNSQLLYTII